MLVDLLRGLNEIALYRRKAAITVTTSSVAVPLLWVALRPTSIEPPYELFACYGRSDRGRIVYSDRQGPRGHGTDASCVREIVEAFVAAHP